MDLTKKYGRRTIMHSTSILKEFVEDLVKEVLRKFNVRQFKKLQSLEGIIDYARISLPLLGEGSGRMAFAYSGGKVLKIGINAKGLAQNAAEKAIWDNTEARTAMAAIYDAGIVDGKVAWLISQIARQLKNQEEFLALTGFHFETFVEITKEFARSNAKSNFEQVTGQIASEFSKRLQHMVTMQDTDNIAYWTAKLQDIKTMSVSPFMKGIISAMSVNRLMPGDLEDLEHFGKTTDGRVVLMDYGLTEEVALAHYPKPKTTAKAKGQTDKDDPAREPTTKTRPGSPKRAKTPVVTVPSVSPASDGTQISTKVGRPRKIGRGQQ